ncbi:MULTISPECIES: anti-sigma factor [unclassified Pseudomonas]|uniref:anti-sigma factor family protein n=1 Tax=unclassified Pseudomonas TaxID=196821 RepID=UPI000876819A|nr:MULTISPECIES: anti-sigma factor [unclassified Pseudomonas]SCZ30714.1 Transmembrane transcriptional regulator (anti-sigma factor RsiW) [Pseudomonas sp. NFACC44-2]SDA40842.1 Transmembrane transcriptional regulator (anti-sigma factor RsiW) [Pseudomonas sp. NFACC51]SEI59110.1 Transmembrane transcriptional regulator (anti-sigma factor RsiW) [Pseudomonas sp. NFACC07-1]SFH51091.1 Transmembrane transcriptional regulator (anti-sigma factor RsiW) [Pseudomonas sp. NFACC54]SFT02442.1 Transmembrane tran
MISMPPSDSDLHAYVDRQLSEADQRLVQAYLANQPEVAARVRAWQQDAQHLRTALSGALQQPPNPDLDPAMIRQHLKHRSRRHLASVAVLLLAIGVGGVSGWQARQMTLLGAAAPMADALQAYRLIAQQGILPADYQTGDEQSMQGWLDRYFTQADRLPDLSGAGFKPVSGRLLSTEQGAAAMVVYQDPSGQKISFYVRPPGPKNFLLPRGSRREGELQAEYWSGSGYNYAMVIPSDAPTVQRLKQTLDF